jgi:menaquinone-dependent protoporphyrinogen IX oxidase
MNTDYLKMKSNVLKLGFVDPIDVWDNNGELCSLGGTQRLRLLTALENEGYSIPPIPINRIEAPDLKTAKKVLLSLASQYGTFNQDGLLEFVVEDFNDLSEVKNEFSLLGVDYEGIKEEHTKDHTDKQDKKPFKCPECGYEP